MSVGKNTPPEKNSLGQIGLKSTNSGAGKVQALLLHCRAEARAKLLIIISIIIVVMIMFVAIIIFIILLFYDYKYIHIIAIIIIIIGVFSKEGQTLGCLFPEGLTLLLPLSSDPPPWLPLPRRSGPRSSLLNSYYYYCYNDSYYCNSYYY